MQVDAIMERAVSVICCNSPAPWVVWEMVDAHGEMIPRGGK